MRESNKVWQPSESRIAEANITKFIEHINRQGFDLKKLRRPAPMVFGS